MKVRTKVYGFLGLILLLGAGGYFLSQQFGSENNVSAANPRGSSESKKSDDESVPVELVMATRGAISSYLSSTTNVRALREVNVAARSDGIVQRVLIEEGDYVKRGQVLARLDDTKLRIQLQSAQQRLAQANLQLEKAQIRQDKAVAQIRNTKEDLSRLQKLLEDQLVSEREVAQLQYTIEDLEHDERVSSSEARELVHRVDELEAEIEQVNLEIARTHVKAPFSGYVIQRQVELGQTVRNLDPLFRLGDFSPLYADVHLSEVEAHRVHPGQAATISSGADESVQVPGRVSRISPVVDQSTGTVKVTVELTRAGGMLKPGAFVRVGIQTDTQTDAVLIPKRAVLEEDGETYVFVVDGDAAKRRRVRVGYQSDGRVEIRQGLSSGAQVVVAGQGALKEGSKVKIVKSVKSRSRDTSAVRASLR